MTNIPFDIHVATSPDDVATVKELFLEYAEWLGHDLHFQAFDEEMATWPDRYDFLLIAKREARAIGAVALKDLGNSICEMKRLYVRDEAKRLGLGRALSLRLIEEARTRGYTAMRLDTLRSMTPAVSLYEHLGFAEIPPYYDNPLDDVVYFELKL